MESIIFLMEKRDGIIKGQASKNGSIKRDWMNKEKNQAQKLHCSQYY